METPFRPQDITTNDVLTTEFVDQMQSNLQWLYENTPRGRWYYDEGIRDSGLVIKSGRIHIPRTKNKNTVLKSVAFHNDFSPKCRPNVTLGICASADKEIFAVVNGPNGKTLPTSDGFDIKVHVRAGSSDGWNIAKGLYIFWQAAGWKERELSDG